MEAKFKIMYLIINIFIIILFTKCNDYSKKLFSEEKKNINKVFYLEENDSTIINRISDIKLYNDNFIIIDRSSSTIVIYNYNGKIIKSFQPTLDLSDSLSIKGIPLSKEYAYITLSQAKKMIPDSNYNSYMKYIVNTFENARLKNKDHLTVIAAIKAFQVKKAKPDHITRVQYLPVIINYDLKNNSKVVNQIEVNKYAVGNGITLLYLSKENKIIMACTTMSQFIKHNYDSVFVLAKYTLLGKYLKPIMKTPVEFIKTGLIYFNFPILKKDKNDNLFAVFPFIPKVYNLTNDSFFKIKNVPDDNINYIDTIIKAGNNKLLRKKAIDSILVKTSTTVHNIEITNNKTLLVYLSSKIEKYKNIYKYIIQEYKYSGKLLKEIPLQKDNENGVIKCISYSKFKNKLIVFRKSNSKGWSYSFKEF